MLRLAAALIAAVLLAAQAPNPTPRPSEPPAKSQGPQAETKSSQQESAQDQRGTKKTPLVVKVVAPRHNEREAAQEANERTQQVITEKSLADYTWYLVDATVALAAIAFVQAGLFVWQLLYMKSGIDDARDNALATMSIANLARDEFNASQRPKIIVDQFEVDESGRFIVKFRAVNIGSLPAHIYETNVTVVLGTPDTIPAAPKYSSAVDRTVRPVGNGEAVGLSGAYSGDEDTAWFAHYVTEKEGTSGPHTIVFGFVRYRDRDEGGTMRETAFCREFDGKRFVPIKNADYEYSY